MSDLDLTKKTNFSQNQNTGSSQNLKDQVADADAEMKRRAGDALRTSADIASEKFKDATDAAKDLASGTADNLEEQAQEKQRSGADFIKRFAGNIREAGRAFENDAPFATRGINSAAEYVEEAAEKIRNGSFRDLVDNATDFAKRQPVAFLGISVLAGFAAVRFLKASGWVGEYSDSVKEGLVEGAGDVTQSVRDATDTLKNEIKDASTETLGRVKQAGIKAVEAAGPSEDALIGISAH
jgi:gas vesicle protein